MGTEEDKPNNGVLLTIFAIGGAAMLGGSAAIVAMTRTEMETQSFEMSGYADLDSVKDLRDAQRKVLREAKLPIDKARDELLGDIQRNPRNASWATPLPTEAPSASVSASADPSASASASVEVPGAGGAPGDAPTAATEAAPEASAPEAHDAPKPPAPSPAPSAPAPEGHEGQSGQDGHDHGGHAHPAPGSSD
jgi:hypothetical protein